ncbi:MULTISPECIES: hypothetical protein [unclassified Bradyrhizobium]
MRSIRRRCIAGFFVALTIWVAGFGRTLAQDCQGGTTRVAHRTFFSSAYAGRLAIAVNAASKERARAAESYCVLNEQYGSMAQVRPRYDQIYLVFNNQPVVSPENAETSFLGIQVKKQSEDGISSVTMRREGDSWIDRPLDRRYATRQFTRRGDDTTVVAQAHQRTQVASTMITSDLLAGFTDAAEQEFAGRVNGSVHGAVRPRDGVGPKRTWDYRERLTFVGGQLPGSSPPFSVTAIWISFAQRSTGQGLWTPDRRVVTGIRRGGASEMDIEMFGSNPEIPSYRYLVKFAN